MNDDPLEPGSDAILRPPVPAGAVRGVRVRGLGLAIAKRLCDLQGWHLAVRSPLESGRGTTFTLELGGSDRALG